MKKILIQASMIGFMMVSLAACGGNGDNNGSVIQQPTAHEKINGIEVPPEPNKALNDSTLAGVDSNKNGVRDDAEIMIASLSSKDSFNNYVLKIAQLETRLATETIDSQLTYNSIINQEVCLNGKRPPSDKQIMSLVDIKNSIVNTRERSAKYTENSIKFNSGLVGVESCQ
jgi:hypothetical protein